MKVLFLQHEKKILILLINLNNRPQPHNRNNFVVTKTIFLLYNLSQHIRFRLTMINVSYTHKREEI